MCVTDLHAFILVPTVSLADTVEFYYPDDDRVTPGPPLPRETYGGMAWTVGNTVYFIQRDSKDLLVLREDLSGWDVYPRQVPNNEDVAQAVLYYV